MVDVLFDSLPTLRIPLSIESNKYTVSEYTQPRTYSARDITSPGSIVFPGVGPCIPAVLHSWNTTVLALHIAPYFSEEQVQIWLDDHIQQYGPNEVWSLDIAERIGRNMRNIVERGSESARRNLLSLMLRQSEIGRSIIPNVTHVDSDIPTVHIGYNLDQKFLKVITY